MQSSDLNDEQRSAIRTLTYRQLVALGYDALAVRYMKAAKVDVEIQRQKVVNMEEEVVRQKRQMNTLQLILTLSIPLTIIACGFMVWSAP